MKKITSKTKHSCFYFHDWRLTNSTKVIDYYSCPFCESRMAVIDDSKGGYYPVDHDWLNCVKNFKPWYDEYWLVKIFRRALLGTASFFALLLMVGLLRHGLSLECEGNFKRMNDNGECMVYRGKGVWVNEALTKEKP